MFGFYERLSLYFNVEEYKTFSWFIICDYKCKFSFFSAVAFELIELWYCIVKYYHLSQNVESTKETAIHGYSTTQTLPQSLQKSWVKKC